MKIGLLIYGSLETISGGYLYDRKLVASLRAAGEQVEIISLPRRRYLASLMDNWTFRLPPGLDLLIQDELSHPSLLIANRRAHPYPVLSLVHHLRCCEQHPAWQNRLYRWIERCYLRSVDGFIFNSKTTRDAVHALVGEDKPYCIAPPPTDRFGPALDPRWVAARAAEPGPLRIVFIGNLIQRKGLHVLLDALVLLPPDLVRLEVIGNPQADPAYAAAMQAKASRIPAPIIFHGALDDPSLAEQLRRAHVLVVPSTYEGFGIVYLEGMGFGLPAIGTTAGAAQEVISHGQNGYLIPPDDAVQLAACLRQLATDRDLLAWMAQNALQRYNQQPCWQETAAQIHRFLRSF
jgi:glycosyltransferase involved in cell wall biosynthesis